MDATQRILKLAAQGLSDKEIADTLKQEGHTNDKGHAFNANAVRSRRLRAEKQSSKISPSDVPETSDKPVELSDKSAISDAMREEIRQIVRKEIKSVTESQSLPKDQIELPPVPGKVTGPHGKPVGEGGRVKIAGTCDKELFTLLEAWRKAKGITLSRALDAALWNFLGKPPLSFEKRQDRK